MYESEKRVREGQSTRQKGSNLRNVTLGELLSRIDYMEANRDGVIGKLPGEPHRTVRFGEGIHKIALLRIDVFGSGVITTLPAAISSRACRGDGDEREEDSEGDRETKHHIR